jgi:type II secretory pathway pseudopilin PulG
MRVLVDTPTLPPSRRAYGGFTLIEVLVIVTIIVMLVAILYVGVVAAMNSAKRAKDQSLIGSIQVALAAFHTDTGQYPPSPSTLPSGVTNPTKLWRTISTSLGGNTMQDFPPMTIPGGASGTPFTGADWLGTCLIGTAPVPASPPSYPTAIAGRPYVTNGRTCGPYMPNDPKYVLTALMVGETDTAYSTNNNINGCTDVFMTATPTFVDSAGNAILYYAANQGYSKPWPTTGNEPTTASAATPYRFIAGDNANVWNTTGGGNPAVQPYDPWNTSVTWPPSRLTTSGTKYLMQVPPFGSAAQPASGAAAVAALGSAQYLLIAFGPDGVPCQTSPANFDDIIVWGP